MPEYPSGTVTFLFTDVEGSTRRWEADSPAMLAAVERHFGLLDAAIAANHGVRFKTIGDAIQAAFPTALDGAKAAIAAQQAITAENWGALGPLPVRMALHTGAATPQNGDYLAPSLNRLARLLSTAAGGQILITEATRNLLRDGLPPEIELRDLGEHRLRDLREAEHVFQLTSSGLPSDFPPIQSLSRPTSNLPTQVNAFIGRESEIADVKQRLADPAVRLLTLTGPGGTGKTRLAMRVAQDLVEAYPDGVWFVALASTSNPALVASSIAETLGLREAPDQSLRESLRSYLRAKHLLLVLDNFEQVIDAAPLISDLLATCPSLQILATSRAPLRIAGEYDVNVSPLALPATDRPGSIDEALASEAVRLFVDRVKAVRGDLALDERNVATIVAICRRLDGLPLAIELAAARIRLLPLDAILSRLDSRLGLLTGGGRDRPERQQTLRSAIAWSHEMLGAAEQELFRRLGVFSGGWTLEAAEWVGGQRSEGGNDSSSDLRPPTSDSSPGTLDLLATLVDNSLVQKCEPGAAAEPRFTMLQTIQEFAREQLETSGEADTIKNRHADLFLQLADDAEPHLVEVDAASWLNRLDADHDNLRSALDWLRGSSDADRAIQLAAALWRFWLLRGHISEGRELLEKTLSLEATANGTVAHAIVLDGAGVLAETQGDYDRAESLHRQALALSRNLDDQQGIARALDNLGVVAFERGQDDLADSLLEESLTLARDGGEDHLVATGLNDLGRVAFHRGELPRAASLFQESLDLRRKNSSDSEIARSLNNLGWVAFGLGDFTRAQRLFEESLERNRAVGDTWGAAAPLNALALAVRRDGDVPRAIALYRESLELFHGAGDTKNAAVVLLNLAGAQRESGNMGEATSSFLEALAGFRAVDDRAGIIESLGWIGSVLVGEGQFSTATHILAVATRLAEEQDAYRDLIGTEQFASDVAAARTALNESGFHAEWEAGTARSIDDLLSETMERLAVDQAADRPTRSSAGAPSPAA
jgi:predicted ATPase/class 3 adenylate cyclase/Tfp pilus assembly protein PilF